MSGFDFSSLRLPSPAELNAQWMEKTLRELNDEQMQNLATAIRELITTLEKGLKAEEQLLVLCNTAAGIMTVARFNFPTWNVAIIVGVDQQGNQTILLSNVQALQLTCKVMKSQPNTKRVPIGFTLPTESNTP